MQKKENKKKKTQAEKVLDYVRDFGAITSWDAIRDLGITRLAAKIHDLERDGYKFRHEVVTAKNRLDEPIWFTRYSLEGKD